MDRERLLWLMAEGEEEEEEEKQTPRGVTARAGSSGSDAPSCAHVFKVGFRAGLPGVGAFERKPHRLALVDPAGRRHKAGEKSVLYGDLSNSLDQQGKAALYLGELATCPAFPPSPLPHDSPKLHSSWAIIYPGHPASRS